MTIDRSAAIAAAEAAVVAANAEVARLTAQLAAEQTAGDQGSRKLTWADGQAAARKRHPGRTRSELAAGTGTTNGIAEARRRAALRGGRGTAA